MADAWVQPKWNNVTTGRSAEANRRSTRELAGSINSGAAWHCARPNRRAEAAQRRAGRGLPAIVGPAGVTTGSHERRFSANRKDGLAQDVDCAETGRVGSAAGRRRQPLTEAAPARRHERWPFSGRAGAREAKVATSSTSIVPGTAPVPCRVYMVNSETGRKPPPPSGILRLLAEAGSDAGLGSPASGHRARLSGAEGPGGQGQAGANLRPLGT